MTTHTKIQSLLYDYLRNELPADDRSMVENHIASCKRCTSELKSLKNVFRYIHPPKVQPAAERPQAFWNYFADHVEEKLKSGELKDRAPLVSWIDDLVSLFFIKMRFVAVFIAALAVMVVTIVVWKYYAPQRHEPVPLRESVAKDTQRFEPVDDMMRQYFHKSKILLIGISNMKTSVNQTIDLSVERERSRELVHEARYLKYSGIDRRSAKLIGDLQRILLELANMKEESDVPGVEMIRTGIHQENLLFKIRMAEAMYDTARFADAKYSY